ncbi:hypothetical protein [Streptomyces sp. NPDC001914]|uniref:hypothetical protein n=1 Tax=Streptomyces sp. NPDC001914 TaxID=3364623 RepID=UPI0036B369D4
MSRPKSRPKPDHQHAAEQARQMPGTWVLAGPYASTANAKVAALHVRQGERGRLPAYTPAGAFKARSELTQEGADLWVCFTEAPTDGGEQ